MNSTPRCKYLTTVSRGLNWNESRAYLCLSAQPTAFEKANRSQCKYDSSYEEAKRVQQTVARRASMMER
jgi:hypothetical protein